MTTQKQNMVFSILGSVIGLTFICPVLAHAKGHSQSIGSYPTVSFPSPDKPLSIVKWGKNYKHHQGKGFDRPASGFSGSISFPFSRGFISINVGEKQYHYRQGNYYQKKRRVYEVVAAPLGAHVPYLPMGHEIIVVDGQPYYTYNNVYYRHSQRGYVVVQEPHKRRKRKFKHHKRSRWNKRNKEFVTVKIPKVWGGYTTVRLKKYLDGFKGPKGEYYHRFPSTNQLTLTYGY